jgi:excisionase family DNA binding protein
MAEEPRYYTTQQVANLLGVSVPTVVNWVKQGRLEAHKTPGGHRRITPQALTEFARRFAYPLPFASPDPNPVPGTRVLVVDAERDFGEMVAEYLDLKGGMSVRVVDNAFDAGVQLAAFQPHLVILDLELSTVDGFAVARTIRSMDQDPRIRLLASTAFRDTVPVERLMEAGIDGILEKPIKLDELLNTVVAFLR